MLNKKVFVFHCDPGHAWLAVKIKDLELLGISCEEISCSSYVRGKTVYLEEDGDANIFIRAFLDKFAVRPNIRESFQENTFIRRLPSFRKALYC